MEKQTVNLYDLIAAPPSAPLGVPEVEAASQVRQTYEALLAKFESGDLDPLDLEQDIVLMRAIIINFINRWEEFSDALIMWYMDKRGKPPEKIMDLAQAAVMLEQVSRVVARMHDIRQSSSISLGYLKAVMDRMALVVAKHIDDATKLDAIAKDWDAIDVDPRSVRGSANTP